MWLYLQRDSCDEEAEKNMLLESESAFIGELMIETSLKKKSWSPVRCKKKKCINDDITSYD